jgi:Domain of unknown function (DUF4160)
VQWLHISPLLATLGNCEIYVYAGDHNPPHFHLRGPDSRALVNIATLEVMAGKASRKDLLEALEWASVPENLERLATEWRRLNEREE